MQFLMKVISLILLFFCSSFITSYSQFSNPFLSNKKTKDNIYSQDKRTVLIVFDASRSMEDKIRGETKIHIAKRVLEDVLLKAATNINIGFRVYGASEPTNNLQFDCSDSKLLVIPATNNRRSIISEVHKILPQGFTPITYSLSLAVQDLVPYKGEKSIILISDGLETCGGDPCHLAKELTTSNIDLKIDVVGFGVRDDWEAQQQLMCIALNTHGKYYSADSAEELTRGLFESINKTVTGRIILKGVKEVEVQTEETAGYEEIPKLESEKLNLKNKK